MFFIFIRPMVDQAISTIAGEANKATSLLDGLKSVAAQVPQAWIGDDANEFAADFQRKIVAGMIELIAAIGGININLTRGANIVDNADRACRGLASGLGDVFGSIF